MKNSIENYWNKRIESDKKFPELEYLEKPCHDCAVLCGFYKDLSDDLSNMNINIRERISRKWFCHNHPNKACRGNANNVGIFNK